MTSSITSTAGKKHQVVSNRNLWNNLAAIHPETKLYDLKGFLEGECTLSSIDQNILGDIRGKRILHLQCHFGLDSLSLARLGATVTGVDFSEVAVKKARELNDQLNLNASFVCCDVNELDLHLNDRYDIVFASFGVIGWHYDLNKWARIVEHFMEDHGRFCFAEFHPVRWMLSDDYSRMQYSYFNTETIIGENEGSYADPEAKDLGTSYCWNHSLSELFEALESHNLVIRKFREFDYLPSASFQNAVEKDGEYRIKGLEKILPMAYSLIATKDLQNKTPQTTSASLPV